MWRKSGSENDRNAEMLKRKATKIKPKETIGIFMTQNEERRFKEFNTQSKRGK